MLARWLVQLKVSTFNQLDQSANSSDNTAHSYTELVSSLAVSAVLTEGWPGWVGLGGWFKYQDGIPTEQSPISVLTMLGVE